MSTALHAVLAVLLAVAAGGGAEAYVRAGNGASHGLHRLKTGPAGTTNVLPPLDAITTPASAAYGFRRLRTAYAGPAMKVFSVANGFLDIGFVGNEFDWATAAAFCPGETCIISIGYDQSGNNRTGNQSGSAPTLRFNCAGARPCARANTDGAYLVYAGPVWVAKTSLVAIGMRASGTEQCGWVQKGNNVFTAGPAPNQWYSSDYTSADYTFGPAAEGQWHAGMAITPANATPSIGRVDATETSGPAQTGAAGAGNILFWNGSAATDCRHMEVMVWDNYALTPAERNALSTNQRNWMGLP